MEGPFFHLSHKVTLSQHDMKQHYSVSVLIQITVPKVTDPISCTNVMNPQSSLRQPDGFQLSFMN